MKKILILCALLSVAATARGASIDELAWMAGSWTAEGRSGTSEELWTEPAGGLMLGLNRTIRREGRASFEFLRIEEREGAVTYLASPGGAVPTPFTLVGTKGERAVFENREHDFPQRIIYWKKEGDLCARVESLEGEGQEWCWKKKSR
ncbi:MAG TPA: DUF6265 family protein [Thermoanaerobaculia bacterium]|nr:DUF6265 family protein [Thermoanaerobaculia bacterium]